MADQKITQLTEITDPQSGDELNVVDNSATPTSKRVTLLNLLKKMFGDVDYDGNGILNAKIQTTTNAQTGTTYTLVLTDASKHITMTNASANTLTVPPNSSVAFPTGTRLMVQQKGAGSTTIAAGSGVTIDVPASVALEIGEQYGSRGLLKTATDTWELI